MEGGAGENVTWVNPSKNGKRSSTLNLDDGITAEKVNTPLMYLYLNVSTRRLPPK